MLREIQRIDNELVLLQQSLCLSRDANAALLAVGLHLVRDENILTENVVSDHLCANNAAYNFTRVNSNAHVQVPQGTIFGGRTLLRNDFDHLETDLNYAEGLLNLHDL